MNFIDYVTLMLINMTAGLMILGCFLWNDMAQDKQHRWAPGFAVL